MTAYRRQLPQLGNQLFLTDAGLETELIFHDGIELPLFASFELLRTEAGYRRLHDYYSRYARMALDYGLGLVLESPTWRANRDWAQRLGHNTDMLRHLNHRAIALLEEVRADYAPQGLVQVISGCVGPRGDGYQCGMGQVQEACDYHHEQIAMLAETGADFISGMTMGSVEEAAGVALAARACGMPVVLSFTLETDARLPTGETLQEAIAAVDARTDAYPAYYMINCAHVSHFEHGLPEGQPLQRLRGVRANASRLSHAELDESSTLDDGDPLEFGMDYVRLQGLLPGLRVAGGCCGTDHRHIEQVCRHLAAQAVVS